VNKGKLHWQRTLTARAIDSVPRRFNCPVGAFDPI
jgi:hypothetical protein